MEGSTVYESLTFLRCRFVRIFPQQWSGKAALRVELYGYDAGKKTASKLKPFLRKIENFFYSTTIDHILKVSFNFVSVPARKFCCLRAKVALTTHLLGTRYFKRGPMNQYLSNMQKRRNSWKVKEMKMAVYLKHRWGIPFYTQ